MPIEINNSDFLPGIFKQIDWFGDSLTQGAGGTSAPTQLASLLHPRYINNWGIGGQTMEQIAARQGGKPVFITISGNAFNGTSPVAITAISTQLLSTPADATAKYISGMVAGVPCRIMRTVVSTVETYVIVPGSTSTAQVPANSIFYPDQGFNARKSIQGLWLGRNNVPNVSGLPDLLDSCIAQIDRPRRFFIIGVSNGLTEITGTTNYNAIMAVNNILRASYPKNYIESTPPTVGEMAAMGYTPSSQDNIDIANNTIPTGMRSDAIHFNTSGYQLIANRCHELFKRYGW